jgi:tetratricopeptide (TPR) repeat protein
VLKSLGLFDRPAAIGCLKTILDPPEIPGWTEPLRGVEEYDLDRISRRLEGLGLVTCHRAIEHGRALLAVDAHPLIREYFAARLRSEETPGWTEAHKRLFGYLATLNSGRALDKPDMLDPLYQAVAHGCHAGLHQRAFDEVFWPQICGGDQQLSTSKFGAVNSDLATLTCFFDKPWSQLSVNLDSGTQMKIASLAGFRLRSSGRFSEAEPLMSRALAHFEAEAEWERAAKEAGNLSVLYMHAGRLVESAAVARKAVGFATTLVERTAATASISAAHERVYAAARELQSNRLATLGDPLIQMGPAERRNAMEVFTQAEKIQAELHPERPLLYSTKGYRYAEFLLDLGRFDEVLDRTDRIKNWTTKDYELLDRGQIALLRARAFMLRAKVSKLDSDLRSAESWIQLAVDDLRRANYQESVVCALLVQANIDAGDAAAPAPALSRAEVALNEAWDIALRGPLRLFQIDILLARVRIFGVRTSDALVTGYPWSSAGADLKQARQWIEVSGYRRRSVEAEHLLKCLAGDLGQH